MANLDKTFYDEEFHGVSIPEDEFDRLADIASEVIYDICILKPNEADLTDNTYKKAIAYQVELLYEQGGIDAIVGKSEASQFGGSESLGDYSVSAGNNAKDYGVMQHNGIPVSAIAVMLLRKLGLMTRWAYAKRK